MAQANAAQITDAVRSALHRERRLGPRFDIERVAVEDDDVLVLEGTVDRLAHKKLALLRAAAVPGVVAIIDRVRVAAVPEGDRHIRAQLREIFARQSDFLGIELREDVAEGVIATHYEPVAGATGSAAGRIDIEVNEGIVTLNGSVPSLVHKRLAGAMAWWVRGVRDVINGIVVEPEENDSPDQIEEAIRIILDRNPSVDAAQIRVGVRGRLVRLTGLMHSEGARANAEDTVWSVFGVDDVLNEIEVRL